MLAVGTLQATFTVKEVSGSLATGVMVGVGSRAVAVRTTCALKVSLVRVTRPVAASVPSKVTVMVAAVVVAGMLFCDRAKCALSQVSVIGAVRNAEVTSKEPVSVVELKFSALGVTAMAASCAMV